MFKFVIKIDLTFLYLFIININFNEIISVSDIFKVLSALFMCTPTENKEVLTFIQIFS